MYKLIVIFAVFGFACNSKVKNNPHNTYTANDVTQISGLELFSNEPLKNDLVDFFVGCDYCPSNIAMEDQESLVYGIINFLKQQTGAGQYFLIVSETRCLLKNFFHYQKINSFQIS